MHTKDFLAQELERAGLPKMAAKARTGYYHDFLSPLPAPCMQLLSDLEMVGTPEAAALIARHLDGEFDASLEESSEWARSADGQGSMKRLLSEL